MSRPSDWSILQLDRDPIPGDWSDVNSAATRYGAIADAIERAKDDLLRVFQDEQLCSEAIEAARETALQVADRIGRAKARYRGVADALAGYVEPLRSAQDDSINILNAALGASGDCVHAQHELVEWQHRYDDALATADPTAIDEARRHRDHWQHKFSESNQDISGAIARLNAVIEDRDRAADHAAGLIENVKNSGDLNDGFWDKVDQFYDDNPWIEQAIEIAGWVAAVLAVIVMFVPGLNLVVAAVIGVVIAAVAVIGVLNAWVKVGAGRESVAEAVVETALAVVPFGVGKGLKMIAGKSVIEATSTLMHSASGSAISGVTKSVAKSVVEEFIAGGAAATKKELQNLLDLSSLAKTPLLESEAVLHGLTVASRWDAAHTVFDAVENAHTGLTVLYPDLPKAEEQASYGVVENVLGKQPMNSWRNANW